eukprot:CAMPEP_0118896640 /NCGR_PEP_ID=MMETSP1166-20130328/4408_1 /TAXON_ID=1104430 /ORGANISM="Chrysoreinhardia sp, Strain CCMP3193" /LENGTH=619 /DNA_ID=CAMNT_0006835699 /DNA_START=239 /DNA_END=2098 /DNA_ORIENTATION=+
MIVKRWLHYFGVSERDIHSAQWDRMASELSKRLNRSKADTALFQLEPDSSVSSPPVWLMLLVLSSVGQSLLLPLGRTACDSSLLSLAFNHTAIVDCAVGSSKYLPPTVCTDKKLVTLLIHDVLQGSIFKICGACTNSRTIGRSMYRNTFNSATRLATLTASSVKTSCYVPTVLGAIGQRLRTSSLCLTSGWRLLCEELTLQLQQEHGLFNTGIQSRTDWILQPERSSSRKKRRGYLQRAIVHSSRLARQNDPKLPRLSVYTITTELVTLVTTANSVTCHQSGCMSTCSEVLIRLWELFQPGSRRTLISHISTQADVIECLLFCAFCVYQCNEQEHAYTPRRTMCLFRQLVCNLLSLGTTYLELHTKLDSRSNEELRARRAVTASALNRALELSTSVSQIIVSEDKSQECLYELAPRDKSRSTWKEAALCAAVAPCVSHGLLLSLGRHLEECAGSVPTVTELTYASSLVWRASASHLSYQRRLLQDMICIIRGDSFSRADYHGDFTNLTAGKVATAAVLLDCSAGPFALEVVALLIAALAAHDPVTMVTAIFFCGVARKARAPFSEECSYVLATLISSFAHTFLGTNTAHSLLSLRETHELAEAVLTQLDYGSKTRPPRV